MQVVGCVYRWVQRCGIMDMVYKVQGKWCHKQFCRNYGNNGKTTTAIMETVAA